MALARIITRSQACSRELALDLLSRGYAVEIISPDKIPDDIADLELRIDEGPGDQLIGSVTSHDGEHSASLDFVHQLRAPMINFKRSPAETVETHHFGEEPIALHAEHVAKPAIAENQDSEPIAEATVRSEIVEKPALEESITVGEIPIETNYIEPSSPVLETLSEPDYSESTIETDAETERDLPVLPRASRSFWRPVLAVASFCTVVLIFGFALHHVQRASAHDSVAAPAVKNPVSSNAAVTNAPAQRDTVSTASKVAPDPSAPETIAKAAVPAIPSKPDSMPIATATIPAGDVKPLPTRTRSNLSSKHRDDIVARDTVTYLDSRYKPAQKTKSSKPKRVAHKHARSPHRETGVAANTVTYLNGAKAPN